MNMDSDQAPRRMMRASWRCFRGKSINFNLDGDVGNLSSIEILHRAKVAQGVVDNVKQLMNSVDLVAEINNDKAIST